MANYTKFGKAALQPQMWTYHVPRWPIKEEYFKPRKWEITLGKIENGSGLIPVGTGEILHTKIPN